MVAAAKNLIAPTPPRADHFEQSAFFQGETTEERRERLVVEVFRRFGAAANQARYSIQLEERIATSELTATKLYIVRLTFRDPTKRETLISAAIAKDDRPEISVVKFCPIIWPDTQPAASADFRGASEFVAVAMSPEIKPGYVYAATFLRYRVTSGSDSLSFVTWPITTAAGERLPRGFRP